MMKINEPNIEDFQPLLIDFDRDGGIVEKGTLRSTKELAKRTVLTSSQVKAVEMIIEKEHEKRINEMFTKWLANKNDND